MSTLVDLYDSLRQRDRLSISPLLLELNHGRLDFLRPVGVDLTGCHLRGEDNCNAQHRFEVAHTSRVAAGQLEFDTSVYRVRRIVAPGADDVFLEPSPDRRRLLPDSRRLDFHSGPYQFRSPE